MMRLKIAKTQKTINPTPLKNKQFFIGVALGENSLAETGISIINRNLELIFVDKLFSNQDVIHAINNFNGTTDSIVMLSLAPTPEDLASKWRTEERQIHAFSLYESAENMLWTGRFSERGNEIYHTLNKFGVSTFRYNIHIAKMTLNLHPPFKMRSQPGCKYLQTVIQDGLSVNNLPSNLIPISSLDALIGAYTGWLLATSQEEEGYKFGNKFCDQNVVIPLKTNPRPQREIEDRTAKARAKKKKKKKKK